MGKINKQAKKRNSKRFMEYLRPFLGLFAAGFMAILLATISRLSGPLILKALIDVAIPRGDTSLMIRYALLYLAIVIGMGGLSYFQSYTIMKLGLNVVTGIKRDLFSHLLTLPVSYFDQHPVGELMARVENDTEKVKQLFSETGIMLAANTVYFIGMFVVFFSLDARVAAFILVPTPFLLTGFFLVFGKLRPLYEASRKKYAEITAIATEFIQGIEVLRAFDKREYAARRMEEVSLQKQKVEVKASLIEYSTFGFMGFLGGPVLIVFIIHLVAPGIFTGAFTIGTLLVFIEYGMRLFEPLFSIGENIRGIQQARVALGRIFGILDTESESPGNGGSPQFGREIEFRHVSFEYKEGETVLDDVSFTIPHGKSIALVGASGSGKTTTIGLLARFHTAKSGQILVDGIPLGTIGLKEWRRRIALVLQDIYLFPGTILENIRLYDDTISVEAVQDALATVQAMDFVARLPEGLYTELHERGGNLSMGEKQLLSFARAVAFDADIVIMDEATASVDVATERRIQKSMEILLGGRTSVIVAHRLSSVLKADMILYFKGGRIIASGRHEELLAALPEYRELVRLQFPVLESEPEPAS
jgi:ATP-binding cassette, subfamily B, multidrug efflux pump